MGKTPKLQPDDPKQSQRFFETAKTLEVDESGKAFGRAFKKVIPKARRRVPPKTP